MKIPTDQYFEKYLLFHFGLLILAVILLGVVCFFLWKQIGLQSVIDESLAKQILNLQNQVLRKNPPAITPPTTDETAGWKTYSNAEFGFEFKYPADKNYGVDQVSPDTVPGDPHNRIAFIIGTPVVPAYVITIREHIASLEELKSLWEKELAANTVPAGIVVKPTWDNISVADKAAIEMSYQQFVGGYSGITHRIGLMKSNSEAYDIFLSGGEEKEFNQIVSTFKITK